MKAKPNAETRDATDSVRGRIEAILTAAIGGPDEGKAKHRVPLADPALALLAGMAKLRITADPTETVFPGSVAHKRLSNMALPTVLRRMERPDLTAHGFRSTFRDWAAEAINYPTEMAEMALAHTVGNKVGAAYSRRPVREAP